MLIISHKSIKEFTDYLDFKKIPYIKTIDNPNLDERIADHPDLSLCKVDENTIIIDASVSSYYKDKLPHIRIIKGEKVSYKYPNDSIYNVVSFKEFYIHNNFTEKNIRKYFKNKDHLFVKQGYTRCSTIVLNDSLLTSDLGIYKRLKDKLKIYLLNEEEIELDGFSKGFLGGCFGLVDEKIALFNGNIERLSSYDIIKSIIVKEKLDLLYPDSNLLDTGSLIWI